MRAINLICTTAAFITILLGVLLGSAMVTASVHQALMPARPFIAN